MKQPDFDPGSFRDQEGRVFYQDGRVLRSLNDQALKNWQALSQAAFFQPLVDQGKLVSSKALSPQEVQQILIPGPWKAVLEHQILPFISYPYEWPFGMLKDAALLQLELILIALEEDMILKDCSAFNVQWVGTNPVFIDIPSFRKVAPGEPWVGYRQFCQMFLYPLFLQAFKDVPSQSWLRGSLDGIPPEQCWALLSLRDLFRRGVFFHVFLMSKIQNAYASTQINIKNELKASGFNKVLIKKNVSNMKKIIDGLEWNRKKSEWSDYSLNNSYSAVDWKKKEAFIQKSAQSRRWKLAWELGCNNGFFSRIVARYAGAVVAMDLDALVIERLYQELKKEKQKTIIPLVINIADIPGGLGWRGMERKSLTNRGKPDLTLCLALVHHLAIGANIPLKEFVDWIAGLTRHLVIEFVTKEDPMTKRLLLNKEDHYRDYDVAHFEKYLEESFTVHARETLECGTRILYFAESKSKTP